MTGDSCGPAAPDASRVRGARFNKVHNFVPTIFNVNLPIASPRYCIGPLRIL